MHCKICNNYQVDIFDENIVLNKYSIKYYRCSHCGAIFTEKPFWLNESYSDAIARTDVGLVNRNRQLLPIIKNIINTFYNDKKTFLDFAGGYGLLVRMLRDEGYNFHWYDKYCQNLFNPTFVEISSINKFFDAITAIEVFEHLDNPVEELKPILNYTDNLIFTTETIPNNTIDTKSWNYFALETGQHITFYTNKALAILAANFGMNYMGSNFVHIFSRKQLNTTAFENCFKQIINDNKRQSLLMEDYKKAVDECKIIARR